MSINNAKRPVLPGQTFVAYINDNTCSVGVVIERNNTSEKWKVLVLGHFEDNREELRRGVFARPFPYHFPGYTEIQERHIVVYDFELEIALCKMRDSAWWKSLEPPCYANLIARYFRPRQLQELQYIDTARHLLNGGTIDNFKSFGGRDDETFLKLWAVLYSHFPAHVGRPPKECDSENSNGYYTIDLECDPSRVTWGIRPTGYKKNGATLS